jgi:hypothetical protein
MVWITVGVVLAGGSLLATIATLIVAWLILGAVRRSERAGDERLEILRDQQQRLAFLNEERLQLLRALERALDLLGEEIGEHRRRLEPPSAPATAQEEDGRGPRETPAAERRPEGSPRPGPPATGGEEEGSEPRSLWWGRRRFLGF